MAERMTPTGLLGIALVAASSLVNGQGPEQGLSDPMRPPSASALSGAAPIEVEAEASGPRLQSILISPTRKLAVISGQTVALGGRYGDATLVAISEASVVLKRGAERETLRLLPAAEKKPAARRAGRAKEKGEGR